MAVFRCDDPEFGIVKINTRSGMRRASMRWVDGMLCISMPPEGTTIQNVADLIDRNREGLRRLRKGTVMPAPFAVGQRIECYGCAITIKTQDRLPQTLLFGYGDEPEYTLSVPAGVDLSDRVVHRGVAKALLKMMAYGAQVHLLPHARDVAARIGVMPTRFEVGRGMRKLGHCTTGRVVQLSCALMMLPADLIDYVICHELAHLSHMDHSPAFHALCNHYLDGHERELEQRLRAFRWPVVK